MCALAEGNIELQDVKEEIRTGKSSAKSGESYAGRPLKDIVRDALERVEKEAIQEILCQTGWRKSETARILGISRPTLDAKIEAYGLRRVNV